MPSRDEIKPQVLAVLEAVSQKHPVQEVHRLWEDLGMGPIVRKAMALPYTEIALKYPNGIPVTQAVAGELETVAESIDLVTARANGEK